MEGFHSLLRCSLLRWHIEISNLNCKSQITEILKKSAVKFPTCWKMHRRASHAILMHNGGILKPLRCIKIACDALRCIFQHVDNSPPDFGISQLFIARFTNSLRYFDGDSMSVYVLCWSKFSVKYFLLPSQQWTSQENMETFHRE